MKLTEGVYLHFIENRQFKSQRIKVRFSAPISRKTLAGRVLSASILETANKVYPTSQAFRQKLASLYGADFSTRLDKKGAVHLLDLDFSYLAADYLAGQDLTGEILDFLEICLFHPLTQADSFDDQLFQLQQKNIVNDLEAEIEDHFYHADQITNQLFYQDEALSLPHQADIEMVKTETPQSAFRSFQKMLHQDRIDIFCLGQFEQEKVLTKFETFKFLPRQPELDFSKKPVFSEVIRKKIEKQAIQQSVLEMAYYVPADYTSSNYFSLLVLNSLLGASPHSRLFSQIRETSSLAYIIGSEINSLTSCLKIYAGIDRDKRQEVIQGINRQWQTIKKGKFSLEELNQVKRLLRHNLLLNQDRQIGLIEEAYCLQIFGHKAHRLDNLLTGVDSVSKEDVMSLTSKVKLQALYFMEGQR